MDEILVERHQLNVNHVNLNGYATMGDLTLGLKSYFAIYDEESPLTVLAHRTPVVDMVSSGDERRASTANRSSIHGASDVEMVHRSLRVFICRRRRYVKSRWDGSKGRGWGTEPPAQRGAFLGLSSEERSASKLARDVHRLLL